MNSNERTFYHNPHSNRFYVAQEPYLVEIDCSDDCRADVSIAKVRLVFVGINWMQSAKCITEKTFKRRITPFLKHHEIDYKIIDML